jgi:hypothetical protein
MYVGELPIDPTKSRKKKCPVSRKRVSKLGGTAHRIFNSRRCRKGSSSALIEHQDTLCVADKDVAFLAVKNDLMAPPILVPSDLALAPPPTSPLYMEILECNFP